MTAMSGLKTLEPVDGGAEGDGTGDASCAERDGDTRPTASTRPNVGHGIRMRPPRDRERGHTPAGNRYGALERGSGGRAARGRDVRVRLVRYGKAQGGRGDRPLEMQRREGDDRED